MLTFAEQALTLLKSTPVCSLGGLAYSWLARRGVCSLDSCVSASYFFSVPSAITSVPCSTCVNHIHVS